MAMPEEAFIGAHEQDLTGPPYGNGRWVEDGVLHVSLLPIPGADGEDVLQGPDLHLVEGGEVQSDPSKDETVAFEVIQPNFIPEDESVAEVIAIKAARGLAAMRRLASRERRETPFRALKTGREQQRRQRTEPQQTSPIADSAPFKPLLKPKVPRDQADATLRRHSRQFKSIADATKGSSWS